jgi:hypothetical protein
MRVENSVWKALDAQKEAQKLAMREAYSCQWAPRKGRYLVKNKNIIGGEDKGFHVAEYCLKPETNTDEKCWWIQATATMNADRAGRLGRYRACSVDRARTLKSSLIATRCTICTDSGPNSAWQRSEAKGNSRHRSGWSALKNAKGARAESRRS